MGKFAISPASVTLSAGIKVVAVSGLSTNKTIGLRLSKEQAIAVATKMLAVAMDETVSGDIFLTAHANKYLTVIRKKK